MRSFFIIFFSRHRRIIPVISYRFITIVITVFYDPRDRKIWRRYEKRRVALFQDTRLWEITRYRFFFWPMGRFPRKYFKYLSFNLYIFIWMFDNCVFFRSRSNKNLSETRQARFSEIGDNSFASISTLECKNGIKCINNIRKYIFLIQFYEYRANAANWRCLWARLQNWWHRLCQPCCVCQTCDYN